MPLRWLASALLPPHVNPGMIDHGDSPHCYCCDMTSRGEHCPVIDFELLIYGDGGAL